MKKMVVEIQEQQKVAAVERRGAAVAQREALTQKQTEVEKLQPRIEVYLTAWKENPLQSTAVASDPQSQLKWSGKGPRNAEDVINMEH